MNELSELYHSRSRYVKIPALDTPAFSLSGEPSYGRAG